MRYASSGRTSIVVTRSEDGGLRVLRGGLTFAEALREVQRLKSQGVEAEIRSSLVPLYEQEARRRR